MDPTTAAMTDPHIVHGTAVALPADGDFLGESSAVADPWQAILLRGPSGSGKSDLALRLLERGGRLIADDQVTLRAPEKTIYCTAVDALRELMEVRGIGLLRIPALATAPLALVVDLVPREDVARLPEPQYVSFFGHTVPLVRLHAFDASTPAKIQAALALAAEPQLAVR